MTTTRARARDGSIVTVQRTRAEQIGRAAQCCKRPHLSGGFVVGDSHAECALHVTAYDAATCAIVEQEREGNGTELFSKPESPAIFWPRR